MPTTFICTSGTSIATNHIRFDELDEKTLSQWDAYQPQIKIARDAIEHKVWVKDFSAKEVSAEVNSLLKMGLKREDTVLLVFSDTIGGKLCAQINRDFLRDKIGCQVDLKLIQRLQAQDSKQFEKDGLKNLIDYITLKLEELMFKDAVINITGGYKGVVPYLALLGILYHVPVKYLFEKSNEVITLTGVPINYDEDILFSVEEKLRKIKKEAFISKEEWLKGISFNDRRFDSLVVEEEPGRITFTAVGEIFYNKFCQDYPEELPKSKLNFGDKKIRLSDDHHGKDILEKFSKKLLKSPYVNGIINSLEYHPEIKDPILAANEDGIIKFVLTCTDRGLGLVIQSTGRNKNETEKIAEILNKKYGN